jgi:hypothetical protein
MRPERRSRAAALVLLISVSAATGCNKQDAEKQNAETVGERLQRECESIIDTADALQSPTWYNNQEIIDVLAKNPEVRPKLGNAYYNKWQQFRDEHPEQWKAAYEVVIKAKEAEYRTDGRPKRIAECVLQRGMRPAAQ